MANQYLVDSPYSPFTIKNQFKAISNGKVYIGEVDKDPLNPSQQIQVYVVDETGSNVPVSQPIQLNAGGYLVYNGQVSKFITLEPYSMVVLSSVNAEMWRVDDISKVDPDNITASNVKDTTNGGSVQDFIDQSEFNFINIYSDISTVNNKIDVIEKDIDAIENTPTFIQKGASKEESGFLVSGVNWISTMRETDADVTSGAAGFNNSGTFQGDGLSNNFAVWGLPFSHSYVCQSRLQWSGSNDNCFIGYNSALTGSIDSATFISVGFSSNGFVFNDKVTLDVLVPASELVVGEYYNVVMFYTVGTYYVSIQKDSESAAATFIVNKILGMPTNAQIGCYSSGDVIRDFRFCATQEKAPWVAPFGGSRSMTTPLTIPSINPAGVQISVHLPAGYDPRITSRLAVFFHGAGGTDKDFWDYTNENSVLTALLRVGYVVMAANYSATAWGNPLSVTQSIAAIEYIKERYNVFNAPFMVVQSMGGLVGLNSILSGGLKPAAVAGIYPASNLLWCYQNGFSAQIESAFGFSGAANFEAATAGYDPLNDNEPIAFNGLKMKFWHSPDDTVVSKAENTDLLKVKAESGGSKFSVVTTSGEHGDPSSFDGDGIVEFFNSI